VAGFRKARTRLIRHDLTIVYPWPVPDPANNMAFAVDQLAVFQGGASRTGTEDEHICVET
jgi:hypothetical protein